MELFAHRLAKSTGVSASVGRPRVRIRIALRRRVAFAADRMDSAGDLAEGDA